MSLANSSGRDKEAFAEFHGTSFAAPLVAGTVAYLMGLEGNYTPWYMLPRLLALASNDTLADIPIGANVMLNNGNGL